jgi:hypothetical protein
VEPPFYDLANVGRNAFIGKSGFDAGLLWSTVYEEGYHMLLSRGIPLTNANILLQEIKIKALQLQNHQYYPFWSAFTHQEIQYGINRNYLRLQNVLEKKWCISNSIVRSN